MSEQRVRRLPSQPLISAPLGESLRQHLSRAAQKRHRLVVSVSGESREACVAAVVALIDLLQNQPEETLWVGSESAPKSTRAPLRWRGARGLLGQEERAIAVDLFEGFEPDALAIITGTLSAGGLLIFFAPPQFHGREQLRGRLQITPHPIEAVGDRLWRRLLARLEEQSETVSLAFVEGRLAQRSPLSSPSPTLPLAEIPDPHPSALLTLRDPPGAYDSIESAHVRERARGAQAALDGAHGDEQRAAVQALLEGFASRGFCPVLIRADRGRGKSSALGLAAAALLIDEGGELVVTAPEKRSVHALFDRVRQTLHAVGEEFKESDEAIYCRAGLLRYIAPRELSSGAVTPRKIFVDEAAALPVTLLQELVLSRPKLAIATTVGGYEGSGRSFDLRFRPALRRRASRLIERSLSDPIRWGIGCPLEALIDDALLLDAVEPYHPKRSAPSFRVRRWSQDALWEDEEALRAHFQLLLTAHYRTRPSDLWRLLDAPNMSLFSVYEAASTARPLVVALVAEEGGLSEEVVSGLYEGRTRIRGHLLAANLILNCGAESGGALKSWRVVRIATRPDVRRQGLATQLLEGIIAQASAEGVSLFGSSFALSADVLRFWSKVDCVPLRVSSRVSQSSGAHSLLVARPLDIAGARCLAPLSASAPERFVDALSDPLRQLEPSLAAALGPRFGRARGAARPPLMLSQEDWRWLASCSYGTRPYEVAPGIAWRLISYWLLDPAPPQLPKEIAELLIAKVLQRQRWTPLCRRFGLESPTLAMRGVVSGLRLLFEAYAPTDAQREALRFPRGPSGEVAESLSPKESSDDSV